MPNHARRGRVGTADAGREAMSRRVSPDAPKQGTTLSYLPALDGIRGVAMIGILGVHAEVYLTAGGFYLLDSFFALSGFLITSLLIVEWRKSGTVKLKIFWARRARRLLPPCSSCSSAWPSSTACSCRRRLCDAPGRCSLRPLLLRQLALHRGGRQLFRPDRPRLALIHMWSLSLEEQFYVVWPLVVLGIFVSADRCGSC